MASLLAVALALAATPADATRDAVASRVGVPAEDVEVRGLYLPEGKDIDGDWIVELPSASAFAGTTSLVLRHRGERFVVRPHVVVWREALVAATDARPGALLTTRTARVPSDRLRGETAVTTGVWRAVVSFHEGDPLTTARVETPPERLEGAAVELEAASAGRLSVRAPGELLQDARAGERVAVLNLATRAVQRGVYLGDGVVALEAR